MCHPLDRLEVILPCLRFRSPWLLVSTRTQAQKSVLSRRTSGPESRSPTLQCSISLTNLKHLVELSQRGLATVQILKRCRHSEVCEPSGFTVRTRAEGGVIVRVRLGRITLEVNAALSKMSSDRLTGPRRRHLHLLLGSLLDTSRPVRPAASAKPGPGCVSVDRF